MDTKNNRLPEEILKAWEVRDPAAVLTTVSREGVPNTVYVSCCGLVEPNRILICDAKFGKTLENLRSGRPEVAFLFFAPDFAAYQLKGRVRYFAEGPILEAGKAFAKPDVETRGVAEVEVTEVYKGSDRLM
ncbi:MAG: pyridoxamine 5'-phosphate oxidase family protein [Opitutales bacterium]